MKKLAFAALTLCMLFGMLSRQAFPAESYVQGHIDTVIVDIDGNVSFHLKEDLKLCASAAGTNWVTVHKNYTTPEGIKNLLTIIMSAKLAGRTVEVRGYSHGDNWACRLEELWVID